MIEAALFATLAEMEARTFDPLTPKSKTGAGPCLAYFNQVFPGKLSKFRKREHDDRVDAKTVEAKAEIEVNGAHAANDKKLAALDTRIELGNQAAQKRIEGGSTAPRVNGDFASVGKPVRPAIKEWERTVTGENGEARFGNDWKPFPIHPGLVGSMLNEIVSQVAYVEMEDISSALAEINPAGRTVNSILNSVKETIYGRSDYRRKLALRRKFGKPASDSPRATRCILILCRSMSVLAARR